MKVLILGMITFISIHLNAQDMILPTDIVTKLFVSTDQQDWESVKTTFSPLVHLDYSSLSGKPTAILSPEAIVTTWKSILLGFEFTHHQIGNFITYKSSNLAKVFCYGTASHYLNDKKGSVWTVIGSYDFDLVSTEQGSWKITSMTFNYKFQDGNTELIQKAINAIK